MRPLGFKGTIFTQVNVLADRSLEICVARQLAHYLISGVYFHFAVRDRSRGLQIELHLKRYLSEAHSAPCPFKMYEVNFVDA